jgi:hypothetical protein
MIDDTIQRIEARLRSSEAMPETTRAELLTLLETLKNEVAQLPPSCVAQAETIARATEVSTEQAVAPERDEQRHRRALDELTDSVRDFEDSHPQLVQVVNNIANTLAGMGI